MLNMTCIKSQFGHFRGKKTKGDNFNFEIAEAFVVVTTKLSAGGMNET